MKLYYMRQGSPEWVDARLGIFTCSNADRVMPPKKYFDKKGNVVCSAASKRYAVELALERLWCSELDNANTLAMQRGTDLEYRAIEVYEYQNSASVTRVGFIESDDETAGGSPDGLIGDDGIIEVKTPMAVKHGMHAVYGEFADEHKGQVQSLLWLTKRKWCDLVSFNPALYPVVARVEPDRSYQGAFTKAMAAFQNLISEACSRLEVPNNWRERIQARSDERAKLEAEERKFFPPQETTERPDAQAQRDFFESHKAEFVGGKF